MAYILGFTYADGNIYQSTLSWDLKNDYELLVKINKALKSNYPILKRKASYRLRISNPIIIKDLGKLGVLPKKSKILKFPKVSNKFLHHFIRGYFDGDGWIYIRKSKNEISVGFSSGSYQFLKILTQFLHKELNLSTNNLRLRNKITKKGKTAITYQVDYSWGNAYKILKYMYFLLNKNDIYMERKYELFQQAVQLYKWVKSGGRKWRSLEDKFKKPMREILLGFWEKGYNGPQIGEILSVHSSSIYRWLIKTNVRPAFTEIRRKKSSK